MDNGTFFIDKRPRLEELLKKRFFYVMSFSAYGGVSGLYDFGTYGCLMLNNIVDMWRHHFVFEESLYEVDATIITPHSVFKASGHVDKFTDYIVFDSVTKDFYRADHLVKQRLSAICNEKGRNQEEIKNDISKIEGLDIGGIENLINKYQIVSDEGHSLTKVNAFNLMFSTNIGPKGLMTGYLRPESAQGQFLNFRRLLELNNDKMPFGSAMIGKAFRNEISPRSGLLRTREFLMAEIEYYVHPSKKTHPKFSEVKDYMLPFLHRGLLEEGIEKPITISVGEACETGIVSNTIIGYYLVRSHLFLKKIGIKEDKIRFRQHLKNEMAHYAIDCWDIDVLTSYGWIECVGCADRSDYDLSTHSEWGNEKLVAREVYPEPLRRKLHKVTFDKKEVGTRFKKNSKVICDMVSAYGEDQLADAKKRLDAGDPIVLWVEDNEIKLYKPTISIELIETIVHVDEYIPHVIEPSFGISRLLYCILEHSYSIRPEDSNRSVLSFLPAISPVKILIVPVMNHIIFSEKILEVEKIFKEEGIKPLVDLSSVSLGKKYCRADEIGILFGMTVDHKTIENNTVTVRERDTTRQIRLHISQLKDVVIGLLEERLDWVSLYEMYREVVPTTP